MARTTYFTTNDTKFIQSIAVGFMNKEEDYIAEKIMPVATVPDKVYQYRQYDLKNYYQITPGMKISSSAEYPNLDTAYTEYSKSVEDYAVSATVLNEDAIRAKAIPGAALNLKTDKLQACVSALKNKYEYDVAAIMQSSANYSSNYATLTTGGTSDGYWWSDFTNSDPATEIVYRKRRMLVDPNTFWCGNVVWWKLSLHPKIVQYVYGETTRAGRVSEEDFKKAFGFKNLYIGSARYNTALPGLTVSLARAWTYYAGMCVVEENMQYFGGLTFGYTASWQPSGYKVKVDQLILDPVENGIEGGLRIGVAEHKSATLTNTELGFLWVNAVDTTLV